jgi:two-component system chemotaxis sensor kinase CheA
MMDSALQTFIDEGDELLVEMEAALLDCERNTWTADTINSIFRAAHTIKGSAGLFGLDAIVSFVHVVETALDRVRVGRSEMRSELAVLLMDCADHIKSLLAIVANGGSGTEPALDLHGDELLARLRVMVGMNDATVQVPTQSAAAEPHIAQVGSSAATDGWHVSVRFKADVLRNGMDPLSFVRYLNTCGDLRGSTLVSDQLPVADELDPEACYIGFELNLVTSADRERIEGAFDFVREDCTLSVLPPHAPLAAYLQAIDTGGSANYELLRACGSLSHAEIEQALLERGANIVAATAVPTTTQNAVAATTADTRRSAKEAATETRSVRVDASKLDHLITLVGELIIGTASANLGARRTRDIDLQESTSRLVDLVEEVRDSALQLRMVKIGATFNRFHRVVSDVARDTGKQIQLVITGEDTELDKTVVEKIGDPLTHLVRNAVDHGIGKPDVRISRGKSPMGTVRLNAYHDSGSIVIEVSDDGSGLKREKIMAKAVERGFIEPGKVLTDSEVYALIFEPGFSTADQVTNLSGRGVGMDVVKRNIEALRGSINIRSKDGQGTTISIRLPLTLAIINGFQVAVGKSVFVVPLEMVEECIEYSSESGHDYANVRGEVLPFIRLHELFDVKRKDTHRESIVIVKHAGIKAGLVVDALLGECQTVIKPLSKMFDEVKCVSGSSILGNGEVALILDVPLLMQQALDTGKKVAGKAASEAAAA